MTARFRRCPVPETEGIQVPQWAEKAGLARVYLTHAEAHGEEAAASFCRALKARAEVEREAIEVVHKLKASREGAS